MPTRLVHLAIDSADPGRLARFWAAALRWEVAAEGDGVANVWPQGYRYPDPVALPLVILAVPEAKFGYTEVRIGFVPAIVSSMLVWQVGHKIARDLLLTARLFDAAEAHRYGLVNEVVSPDRLLPRARELAAQLMENSPSSVRATKRLINGFIAPQLDRQIDEAVRDNARIRTTADFREGITSFLEKRKPRWSGQ